MIELFPYQEVGADFLAGRRRALLFDAPGLGKTAQAIRAADRGGLKCVDTVCPASVVTQWGKAHAQIAEKQDRSFVSRSYEKARKDGVRPNAKAVVLDELHYLKNITSGRTVKLLGYNDYATDGAIYSADYVWGMSGTPSPKNPYDLYPAMRAIVPGSLIVRSGRVMDPYQFMQKFCVMFEGQYGMVIKGGCNLDELQDRLAPYMLRRTKKDVDPEWKEAVCAELWLDPDDVSSDVKKLEKEPFVVAIADAFQKGGYDAVEELAEREETGVARYRRFIGLLKVIPVVKWLLDEFESGLEKIVIVCWHREVIEAIHKKLKDEDVESVVYYGGMTSGQKDKAKATFIKDAKCRAFILQLIAGGTGVDGLQHATGDMILVEWDYIDDNNRQAIHRLDRIGQKSRVLARFVGLEGSLDGAIMATASRRAADNRTLFG